MGTANFGLLAANTGWRNSWAFIVPGRFSSSAYDGLLFVEQSTGYAEIFETDGAGQLQAPLLSQFEPLGGRTTWTHVVPGFFGPSGFTGLLLYDQTAGVGQIYDCDGHGHFQLLRAYSDWSTSWTHIVAGRFVASSPYSSVFFYSAADDNAEIWATDAAGLAGSEPYARFPGVFGTGWTHVVAADFFWTPGYIASTKSLSDLFFYDSAAGTGDLYRLDLVPGGTDSMVVLPPLVTTSTLPRGAAYLVVGNFGGLGNADLVFHDAAAQTLSVFSIADTSALDATGTVAYSANLALRETLAIDAGPADIVAAGRFWRSNPDDHWFDDGPPVSATPPYDPEWRFGAGSFADLLLYDRGAGIGRSYFHQPIPPVVQPISGYITGLTSHGGAAPVSTGSIVPGESIDFHISSRVGPYTIAIYRQGALADGQAEALVATLDGLPTDPVPNEIADMAYADGAAWPVDRSFVVPQWPSGLYLARVEAVQAPAASIDIAFVVRAPAGASNRILLVIADPTYAAYNDWGGRNLYGHVSGSDFVGSYPSASSARVPFAFRLSFERPLHDAGFFNIPQTWEIPFLDWLTRNDLTVDVCTSRDIHFQAPDTADRRLLLFVGHHEYWTAAMRDGVEAFAKAGGNIAFFTGNTCWWQVRFSADGTQIIGYKVAAIDPLSTTADHRLTTVQWFDPSVARPETSLTGVSFQGDEGIYGGADRRFAVMQASHWIFTRTGLSNGRTFGDYGVSARITAGHPLPGGEALRLTSVLSAEPPVQPIDPAPASIASGEMDRFQTGSNGVLSPPNFLKLASIFSTAPGESTLEVGTMGIFSPGSQSGQVFTASTTNWALGLSADASTAGVIDQITRNVVEGLSLDPGQALWTSVSEGSTTPGAPVAMVEIGPEEVALFVSDPGGSVYTCAGTVALGWTPWTSVSEGSTTPGAPIAAVALGSGRAALFLADPGGSVYTTSGSANAGWAPWTGVSEGSTRPGACLCAVTTGPGQTSLFLADPSGSVYTTSGSASTGWAPWTSVSGGSTTPGAPLSVIAIGAGEVALFLADPGGGVYTTSGSVRLGWAPWTSVSEGATTPGGHVSAVATGPNQMALFLADPAGGVYTISGSANTGWGQWTTVSEGATTPGAVVTALAIGLGQIALFLSDPGGGIYTTTGTGTRWGPWRQVSYGLTTPGAPAGAVRLSGGEIVLAVADAAGSIYATTRQSPG